MKMKNYNDNERYQCLKFEQYWAIKNKESRLVDLFAEPLDMPSCFCDEDSARFIRAPKIDTDY